MPTSIGVALSFTRDSDEMEGDDGKPYLTFSAKRSRSGLMMAKVGDRYVASAVDFKGLYWEGSGKIRGPSLRTVGMHTMLCPRCGMVTCSGPDLVSAARRAGIECRSAKDALRLHGVCPNCKMNKVSGQGYLDICGEEGEAVFGKDRIDALKRACDTAKDPFVIPPIVALLPDPDGSGSPENEIPGEFPDLMSEVVREAAEFADDEGPYPLRVCDICEYDPAKYHDVCGWQIVMPDTYSGVASLDAVDSGIRLSGIYSVNLQIFLQDAAGTGGGGSGPRRKWSKKRRPPRVAGL